MKYQIALALAALLFADVDAKGGKGGKGKHGGGKHRKPHKDFDGLVAYCKDEETDTTAVTGRVRLSQATAADDGTENLVKIGGHFRGLPTAADTYSVAVYDTGDATCSGTISTDLALSFTTVVDRSCGGFKRSELAAGLSLDAATLGTSLIGSDVGLADSTGAVVSCCTIALKEEEADDGTRRLQDDGSETDWEALYADGFEGGLGSTMPDMDEDDMDYDAMDDYEKMKEDHEMMHKMMDHEEMHEQMHHEMEKKHEMEEGMMDGWEMMWGDGASSLVATGVIAITAALAF